MLNLRLLMSVMALILVAGCDLAPEDTVVSTPTGLVNKGVMSNAEVNAYKANTSEIVKTTYTKTDGTFELNDLAYTGALYIEVTTTSQTLATCDASAGCGLFKNGLKLPGEYDQDLDGTVDFGDRHYYNNINFKLTSFVSPQSADAENFGVFAVTPLTHLAAQRIKAQDLSTVENIDIINAQVAELFGLDGVDITRVVPPDVTDADKMSEATEAQRLYSTLTAAVASSVTDDKDLVAVINELTDLFVNKGGLIGNSTTQEKITLASLQTLAEEVATKVEIELEVSMDQVQQKLAQEVVENNKPLPDELVEPAVNPLLDLDGDGLNNQQEADLGTDPNVADTDKDGMPDGWEFDNGLNPLSDDSRADSDNDGILNVDEYSEGTNPNNSDSDGDGMSDSWELVNGLDPLINDAAIDSDGDGISNIDELNAGTDPSNTDTDGDGISNADELTNGSQLNVANATIEFVSDADIYSLISDIDSSSLLLLNESETFLNSDDYYQSDLPFITGQIDANGYYDAVSHDISSNEYQLVQPDASGNALEFGSMFLDATPDGRKIVFSTDSTQVLAGEGSSAEIYILNRMSGEVISLDEPTEFDADMVDASISADGRYLVFSSSATNVTTDTSIAGEDVFLKDLNAPTADPILVSRSTLDNTEANGSSSEPQISRNGQRIIFRSSASDLDTTDRSNGSAQYELYVYDVVSTEIKRISKYLVDEVGAGILRAKISADGQSVIYETKLNILDIEPGNSNYGRHLYYINLASCFPALNVDCIPTLITHEENAAGFSDASNGEVGITAGISADGRYVVYLSDGSNLDSSHGPSTIDPQMPFKEIYLWDSQSNKNRLISHYMYQVWGAFPNSQPIDLLLQGMLSTADFSHVYATFGGAGALVDVPTGASCGGEEDCLYKLSLGIEQSDSDGDGLNDRQELAMGTNSNLADSDGDGISDGDEIYLYGTSPLFIDSDEDGIDDNVELAGGTSPRLSDSDGDLLNDYDEINVHGTDATNDDSDGDGMPDGWEVTYSLDPLLDDSTADPDSDTLNNIDEFLYGTYPDDTDWDSDGMLDGWEVYLGLAGEATGNPLEFDEGAGTTDSDNDGLTNFVEFDETNGYVTDPLNPDSDGDGVTDFNEVEQDGTNPNDPTDFIAPSPP
jgi:hypothetical protein